MTEYEEQAESFLERPAVEVAARAMAEHENARVKLGQQIRQYEIVAQLGVGGMGEVYLAEDTRLRRKVALKFLPALHTQDKKLLHRFQQEARAVAALSHPNVCMIHEVVEAEDGLTCIVMEHIEGVNLRELIARESMKIVDVLDVAIQIASALSAAHAAHIVHRDIKPENVMLRHDGYVKVLDFGLAKLAEHRAASVDPDAATKMLSTSPGLVIGTVSYMSPEQARGLPVDARSDLWSLGVVLYEMLTGKQPFRGPTATDVIISIAERSPLPLLDHDAQIPVAFQRIVEKALAKDRDQRYQTADALLADLKELKRELDVGAEVTRYKQTSPVNATTARNRELDITRTSMPRRWIVPAVVAVLILAVLGYALLSRQRTPESQNEIKAIAVLPLENLSGDPSQDYFADGMTDSLITDLAKLGALKVISRPSVMQYKKASKPMPEIGRELNVDAVLTGSVVRAGERVRIAVQLIHAATDRSLWANSYERDLRDVLTLQKEVTRDIVSEIRIKVAPQEMDLGNVRRVNPEAYDHYLRGKFHLNRQSRDSNDAAIAALERAVAIDGSFAAARAQLAQAYVWKFFLFTPDEKQWEEKAFVEVEKALSLDPNLAEAHLARGRLLWTPANDFPHDKAIQEYRKALALDPSLDEARNQLALVYGHIGLLDEAFQELEKALAVNPSNALARFRVGEMQLFQGKYEQALNTLSNTPAEVNPALVGHQRVWALFNLGRKEEASATIDQFLKNFPEDNRGLFTSLQGVIAASSGQQRLAEEKLTLAVEKGRGFGHFHHTAYHVGCAYAIMNKADEAIKWLDVAAQEGFPCYPLFQTDPNLANLRQDPRFVALLAKLKQQWEYHRTLS